MQIVSPQQSSISYLSQSWLRCYKEGKLNHRSTFKVNLFFPEIRLCPLQQLTLFNICFCCYFCYSVLRFCLLD